MSFSGKVTYDSFLGGTNNTGNWIWIDGSPFDYTNLPTSATGSEDNNCLLMLPVTGGPWDAVPCNKTTASRAFVCSVDLRKTLYLEQAYYSKFLC